MSFADQFKLLRKEKGISQEALAESLHISRQAVSKWETGLSQPDTENLVKLAEIFNVSLDELVGTVKTVEKMAVAEKLLTPLVNPYISKLVLVSYIVSFGAVLGFSCYKDMPPLIWIAGGLVGGILLVIKNRKIADSSKTRIVQLLDITAMLILILLGTLLPDYMGLVKQLLIAIPAGIYTAVICWKWFLIENPNQ